MKTASRIVLSLLLVGLVLIASVSSAQANKRVYKALLASTNELHPVVDSTAKGSAVLTIQPDGSVRFLISVRGLSSDPVGGHFHGPATASENAPVIGTICGSGPNWGFYSTCTRNADGLLILEGVIDGGVLYRWGLTGRQFMEWLDGGLLYINFHTTLNPLGETRGQILPR